MKIDLDVPKENETAIQNFFKESKYLIFLSEDGQTKVLVLK